MTSETIGIIGSGAFGSALAISIATSNQNVIQWCREAKTASSIMYDRQNKALLPNIAFPESVTATNNLADLAKCDYIFMVTPAQFTRNICQNIRELNFLNNNITLIACSKGIEASSLMLQSEIIAEILPRNPIAVLSGPTLALEVANCLPSYANLATLDHNHLHNIKNIFKNTNITIHPLNDIIGTQIGGILKNIIAIGCGIAHSLNFGENFHAALINQGIKEAAYLTKCKGGNPQTMIELCGIGDMILTCSSTKSRNFSFGSRIGQGEGIQNILSKAPSIVEGYKSVKPLIDLTKRMQIHLPLCEVIYRILYESQDPKTLLDANLAS